jgi:hypothetical protein
MDWGHAPSRHTRVATALCQQDMLACRLCCVGRYKGLRVKHGIGRNGGPVIDEGVLCPKPTSLLSSFKHSRVGWGGGELLAHQTH